MIWEDLGSDDQESGNLPVLLHQLTYEDGEVLRKRRQVCMHDVSCS
jgi:hypothetical protein